MTQPSLQQCHRELHNVTEDYSSEVQELSGSEQAYVELQQQACSRTWVGGEGRRALA